MFSTTCSIIDTISKERANYSQLDDVEVAYLALTSFEFVFILHLVKEILGIIDLLCWDLQQQSQDIVNAMYLVLGTKSLI